MITDTQRLKHEARIELAKVINEACDEVSQAMDNWPPFNSAHEGYAVLGVKRKHGWVK